jgi:hypothetical protein
VTLSVTSITAGVLLWCGTQAGLALSRVLLALQAVRVYAAGFAFGVAVIPQTMSLAWTSESHRVLFALDSVEWRLGADRSAKQGIEIHLVAILLLALLLVRWRPRAAAT